LAEAALAVAGSALHQATLKEQVAANELAQRFVGITPPDSLPLSMPAALEQSLDYWRDEILKHSHELAAARSEAKLARLHSERTQAERTPDPAFGLRAASERGGSEHVVGVSISIPFSGTARSARAVETLALAEAASQREAAVLRKIRLEAANTFAAAQAAYRGWESAALAADKIRANAELMARAYALGEMSLSEVLMARRLSLETGLAATLARLEAAESRYRLMLDAHQLWPLDDEHRHDE
jgi:outer membrane protein TolC